MHHLCTAGGCDPESLPTVLMVGSVECPGLGRSEKKELYWMDAPVSGSCVSSFKVCSADVGCQVE